MFIRLVNPRVLVKCRKRIEAISDTCRDSILQAFPGVNTVGSLCAYEFIFTLGGKEIFMNVLFLCMLWMSWCAMHSILINVSVARLIKKQISWLTPYYRLLYNGLSLFTFIPLIIATRMADGPVMVSWQSYYAIPVRVVLLVTALLLFIGGAKKYDLLYFLGVKQLQTGEEHLLLSETEIFTETGVFGITRHPWYLGSLLFIWIMLAEYPLPVFLAVCIMSVYLVVGTMLEEKKIVAVYGDSYCLYRQRVSMLFPWKWLARLLRDGVKMTE